jgi:2-polyprenyl-3-methyl-5-hydroxy-6-metoxy-1,4-benzoquinol methylase
MMSVKQPLAAKTEAFDSYWQAPEDVERGYTSFIQYYRVNYLGRLPQDRQSRILVVSCGPGYFVKLLRDEGYLNVEGIDSDPGKVAHAEKRGLPCRVAEAFPFLETKTDAYDVMVCEQELNHLTKDETFQFLALCRTALKPGGQLFVYGLNGANPITGAEALAQNIDHFYTFTEYSLTQFLEHSGFKDVRVFPLELYVFYRNPLNYVGLAATTVLHLAFRALFTLYGKSAKIFTKKVAAVCTKPS